MQEGNRYCTAMLCIDLHYNMVLHCAALHLVALKHVLHFTELKTALHYVVSYSGKRGPIHFKYIPLPDGVPEGKAKSEGLYFTMYPESSPYTDYIIKEHHYDTDSHLNFI